MTFGFGRQSSRQQATSTPVDVTPAEFLQLRGPFSDVLKGLLAGGGGDPLAGIPSFTGPFSAALQPQEGDILTRLQGVLQPGGLGDVAQTYLKDVIGGKFASAESNPFLASFIEAAQRPTLRGLEEVLSRTLPGRFTQGGHFVQPKGSSAFDRAAAIATEGAANALKDIATGISYGAYEGERGRQQQAVTLGQQEVQSVINNLQAQALPRLIEQHGIDQGLAHFRDRLNALIQILTVTGSAAAPRVGQQSQSTGRASGFNFNFGIPTGGAGGG